MGGVTGSPAPKSRKPRPRFPRWLSCDGKEPFSSPQLAARVAKGSARTKKRRGNLSRPLGSYRCPHCGFFHIGGLGRGKEMN